MSVFRAISARVEVSPSAPETASDRVRVGKELFLPRGSPSLAVTRSSFPSSKCGSKPNPPPPSFLFHPYPLSKGERKTVSVRSNPNSGRLTITQHSASGRVSAPRRRRGSLCICRRHRAWIGLVSPPTRFTRSKLGACTPLRAGGPSSARFGSRVRSRWRLWKRRLRGRRRRRLCLWSTWRRRREQWPRGRRRMVVLQGMQ